MKRLVIDVNSALSYYTLGKFSGIGRTTRELVQALSKLPKPEGFEFVLYSQNTKKASGKLLNSPFKARHFNYPNRPLFKRVFKILPLKECFLNYDIMHIPHNHDVVFNASKTLITLHDAMFFSYPEEFLGHQSAQKKIPSLAKSCKGIVTCSEASKADIVKYMHIPESKVKVIPWGIDRSTFFELEITKTTSLLQELNICLPYFLMVSCDIGRKNTVNVMRAFQALDFDVKNHVLVLVWPNPPAAVLKEFEDLIKRKLIMVLGTISDQQLNALYNGAVCSFFPSKYEGFGLPILESFECGTPVVTCQNSSLPEVGGDAAMYVDPDKPEEMTTIMRDFVEGRLLKANFYQQVKAQATKFCWDKTAAAYLEFYKKHLLD